MSNRVIARVTDDGGALLIIQLLGETGWRLPGGPIAVAENAWTAGERYVSRLGLVIEPLDLCVTQVQVPRGAVLFGLTARLVGGTLQTKYRGYLSDWVTRREALRLVDPSISKRFISESFL